ncbi:MAG: 6-phosphogluconolactonase [Gammaproteobacteria bacterium]|nr:6-phosphogluconolactonase [Gammaproteobacteria bacterium]
MNVLTLAGRQLRRYPDLAILSHAAADSVQKIINDCVIESGQCQLALAGGKTPALLYQQLAGPPFLQHIPWGKISCYFGDERCVALDHPESNYRMAMEKLLSTAPIHCDKIYPMVADPQQPQQQAIAYEKLLNLQLPKHHGVPCFDLIILGMGVDGHTASLFPHSLLLLERQRSVAASYVDSLATWRISLTLPVLNAARQVLILVSGSDKADTLARVFHEPAAQLPIQQLTVRDNVVWFVDAAAASLL